MNLRLSWIAVACGSAAIAFLTANAPVASTAAPTVVAQMDDSPTPSPTPSASSEPTTAPQPATSDSR